MEEVYQVAPGIPGVPPTKVIRREPLSDAQKFQILSSYSKGIPVTTIAASVSRDTSLVSKFIQDMLRDMSSIKETNELIGTTCTVELKQKWGQSPTRFLTSSFLSLVEDNAEVYAYYMAQTGDNKFSLEQSGLDVGIAPGVKAQTKDYILRIRGQYLRDLPAVKKYIQAEQDKRIKEYKLEKPQIQMELVSQIEEMKEGVRNDPKQRTNLLKAIELLGRTIGSFTDRVEVEEADAKSGLQLLLEKARKEATVVEAGSYTIEDTDGKEANPTAAH